MDGVVPMSRKLNAQMSNHWSHPPRAVDGYRFPISESPVLRPSLVCGLRGGVADREGTGSTR